MIFGRNNLVQDAPISRLDLLICRNTLMYFTPRRRRGILRHFHFALRDTGVLMLGKSEMMISHRELFAANDLKQRIFVKLPRPTAGRARRRLRRRRTARADADDERTSRGAALEVGPHAAPDRLAHAAG